MMAVTAWEDFQEEVLSSDEPVLALFHASWCPFCRAFLPLFRDAKADGVRMVEVDVSDDESPFWEAFGVEVVPTLILFHQGRVVTRADGRFVRGLSEEDLDRLLRMAREASGKG
jgi:thioredoxin-like negative regulator of GroEL